MISSIVQIRSLYLLISFTLFLLVSVYLIATKKQKLPVTIFKIITILLVLCLAFFIRQLLNQENKYLFFLQVACLAISLVCVVVLVIISYFYNDIFDKNNSTSENETFVKDLINLTNNNIKNQEFKINSDQIKKLDSNKYTYSFSVYVNTFAKFPSKYKKQYLFYRKDDVFDAVMDSSSGHGTNFGVRLDKKRRLFLDYSQQVGVTTTFNTALIKSNFPAKTLTKIVVTVDKTIVNIYIDGIILTKQFKINNLKQPSTSKPIEFGNMPAYLANFSYSNYVIPPTSSIIEYLSNTNSINI